MAAARSAVPHVATLPGAGESPWVRCPQHGGLIYGKILDRNLKVCPECHYHFRLGARERLASLLDPGSFAELRGDVGPSDPIGFRDVKPYAARLTEARQKTGLQEGVVYGTGVIEGKPLIVAAMDFSFIGGTMGTAVGEAITRAIETAVGRRLPLLVITASGGARMQEGCLSLMQMAKTSAALALLAEHRLPYLVLLTDPTYGGVTASFGTLGDVVLAEPDALIGFAGRSVVESTIKQKLPPNFQRADFLLEHGMIDQIVPRRELRATLGKLLACYTEALAGRSPSPAALPKVKPALKVQGPGGERAAWEVVRLARQPGRPTTLQYLSRLCDDFVPLHGDRLFREDGAVVGGLARLGGVWCVVVGTQKGRSLKENVARNFGMPNPEGYRKALRLMQHAAKFRLPVVTFIDTPGAAPGVSAEERGQTVAIARNLLEMARLPVPIVALLTGEGGSGGALALGVADRVLMLENAYYSVISPEGCSVILFKNVTAAPQAAQALRLTAPDLKRLGVIDEIVPEPDGGAHTSIDAAAQFVKSALVRHLGELLAKETPQLLGERQARYRGYGAGPVEEQGADDRSAVA
jgi:acetyl-CoA carboxylase carboxyl transferase subunit beta